MSARSYVIVQLPRERWFRCDRCNGTGSIEMAEDCHKSAGIIPCPTCGHDGIVRQERITVEEYERRKSVGKKVWQKPSFSEAS